MKTILLGCAALLLTACASSTSKPTASVPSAELTTTSGFQQQLQTALQGYDADILPEHYDYKAVNLNNDSWPDAVVLMRHASGYCGNGGCSLMTLVSDASANGALQFVSNTTLVKPPVEKSTRSSHGLHDLYVHTAGGGYPAAHNVLRYDGTQYSPNASMADVVQNPSVAETLFADANTMAQRLRVGDELTVEGMYVSGHEVSSWILCDRSSSYWATGEALVMAPLVKASLDKAKARHKPYQAVFAQARVKVLPAAEDGFATSCEGVVEVLEVLKIMPGKDHCPNF